MMLSAHKKKPAMPKNKSITLILLFILTGWIFCLFASKQQQPQQFFSSSLSLWLIPSFNDDDYNLSDDDPDCIDKESLLELEHELEEELVEHKFDLELEEELRKLKQLEEGNNIEKNANSKSDNNKISSNAHNDNKTNAQKNDQQQQEHDFLDNADDPLLFPFPTPIDPNFKAYVRPDISSFYKNNSKVNENEDFDVEYFSSFTTEIHRSLSFSNHDDNGDSKNKTIKERIPMFQGQAGKFVNISPFPVELYWVGGGGVGTYISYIEPWGSGGTSTFPGHKFYLAKPDSGDKKLCMFHVVFGASVYYYDPFVHPNYDEYATSKVMGKGVAKMIDYDTNKLELSMLGESQLKIYKSHRYNLEFGYQYKNLTGGSEWLSHYPRNAPLHRVWAADYFGQKHTVETKETHFIKYPTDEDLKKTKRKVGKFLRQTLGLDGEKNNTKTLPLQQYRLEGETMNLTLEAVSCHPKAFEVRNFLSSVEVDHMIDVVHGRRLERSTTGDISSHGHNKGSVASSRTSRTTWLQRDSSPIIDAIYRRAADVLKIDEALFRSRSMAERQKFKGYEDIGVPINEQIQIVNYQETQQYTPHHDFGFPNAFTRNGKDQPARSINIAMYLNDEMEGGETSFPRARNAHIPSANIDDTYSAGIKVKPEKGKALIFYMITPDGNLDDLSQHSGEPVISGEKWFSNLWIWDPHR